MVIHVHLSFLARAASLQRAALCPHPLGWTGLDHLRLMIRRDHPKVRHILFGLVHKKKKKSTFSEPKVSSPVAAYSTDLK